MHKLHVYYGTGKGKTTAAMGLALRSAGHGNRVLVGQFVKDGTSGELISLKKLGAIVFISAPLCGFVGEMTIEERKASASAQEQYAADLIEKISELKPQTIILDELGMALDLQMLSQGTAEKLICTALRCGETVATGYNVPKWLLDQADYITHMQAQRHPYDTEKLQARKGVEW